jgi:hypothetical protein
MTPLVRTEEDDLHGPPVRLIRYGARIYVRVVLDARAVVELF